MSNIDDIWASMNDDYVKGLPVPVPCKTKTKTKQTKSSNNNKEELTLTSIISGVDASSLRESRGGASGFETLAQEAINGTSINKKKSSSKVVKEKEKQPKEKGETEKKEKEKEKAKTSCPTSVFESKDDVAIIVKGPEVISLAELMTKIARDIQALSDSDVTTRKRALQHLHKSLLIDFKLATPREYNMLFHDLCKPLFKRFGDSVEKCREIANQITTFLFQHSQDLVPVLSYYFPALLQRLPKDIGFDEQLQIFVLDKEAHLAFKRGKAIDRQDKLYSTDNCHVDYAESSEEIRFASVNGLVTLLNRVRELDCQAILHPYFEDTMNILQAHIHDSNPDMKVLTAEALENMAKITDYELGFKYYGIGLIRALLPQLKHRQFKVRSAALAAIHFIMIVPDRAKRKASGSEAIIDLVGFREDNVLPISAFYKAEVTFNYLAELVSDKSTVVREKLVAFLNALLTEIDDRYDHQQRLLPYILDMLTDEIPLIAQSALNCLKLCGKQYEEEHYDEILLKKQYNVDGDDRINLEKPLPPPFTLSGRPSVGMRLYARGNSKRFLQALVNELTNWVAHTRIKSANLMKMIIVLCEEHLTMEIHSLLPSLIKALKFAREDQDPQLQTILMEVYELLGRYLLPEIYLYYILPRLRNDPDVVAFGMDNESRITVMMFLQALLSGSKSSQIIPFFDELVTVLTDSFILNYSESAKLSLSILNILETLCEVTMKGKKQHVIESFYVTTGRLTSLQVTIRKLFKFLLTVSCLFSSELQVKAMKIMAILSSVESNSSSSALPSTTMKNVELYRLFEGQSSFIYNDILDGEYDIDAFHGMNINIVGGGGGGGTGTGAVEGNNLLEPNLTEHELLQRLFITPWYTIQSQPSLLASFFKFMKKILLQDIGQLQGILDCELRVYNAVSQLFLSMALPIYLNHYPMPNKHCSEFFQVLEKGEDSSTLSANKSTSIIRRRLPGMQIKTKDKVVRAVQCVNEHVDLVLELLVCNNRWGKSIAMITQRMHVFALLTGQYETTLQLLNSNLEPYEEEESDSLVTFPLGDPATLINWLPKLVQSILPLALLPSTPLPLRLTAVALFRGCVNRLKSGVGIDKLRPFSFWTKETETDNQLQAKFAVQTLISVLLAAIHDSDDDVRIQIIEAIGDCASLIIDTNAIKRLQDSADSKRFSAVTLEQAVPMDTVVQLLTRELLVEVQLTAISPVVDYLDMTLRALCVLDPRTFEAVVREEFTSSGGNAGNERKGDFVNDLINHADIISSMQM